MKEILSGIYHWTAEHPEVGIEVSSYYLQEDGILLDPLIPPEGLEWFGERPPRHVILSNRLHVRHSPEFSKHFDCQVWMHQAGIDDTRDVGEVEPFEFGEELPGKIVALEVDAICPDETALFIPRHGGIVAFADGLIREGDGPPGFVDDDLMAESPAAAKEVKRALKAAFRTILETRQFDHLFLAHGYPVIGNGKAALKQFLEGD